MSLHSELKLLCKTQISNILEMTMTHAVKLNNTYNSFLYLAFQVDTSREVVLNKVVFCVVIGNKYLLRVSEKNVLTTIAITGFGVLS